ncbi:MAG: 4'-phosphopantetheinyl transferase superfamily protein [Ferruginibacter sp.]
MPLVYQQNINADTKLGVWNITETEDFFLQKVMLQNEITHPHKRLQHLAGRYLLKELFTDFPLQLIKIADTRKPFLADEAFHFSISHCGNYAAAIASKTSRVGIDIEIPQQKIERIKQKFITEKEIALLKSFHKNEMEGLTIGWSIKEALFKWYGAGEVDFKKHLNIISIEKDYEFFIAHCLLEKDGKISLPVRGTIFNGNSLVWLVS